MSLTNDIMVQMQAVAIEKLEKANAELASELAKAEARLAAAQKVAATASERLADYVLMWDALMQIGRMEAEPLDDPENPVNIARAVLLKVMEVS